MKTRNINVTPKRKAENPPGWPARVFAGHPGGVGGALRVNIRFLAAFKIKFQIQRLEDVPLPKNTAEPWPVPAPAHQPAITHHEP